MSDEMALLIADLYEAAGAARRAGEQIATSVGQTQARWQALSVLSGAPTTVPQAARRLGISRQALQRVVNDLADQGLVEGRPNPEHIGSPLIAILPEGARILRELNTKARAAHRAQQRRLAGLDVAALRDMLQQLARAL